MNDYFTQDNTEGFTDSDLIELNKAVEYFVKELDENDSNYSNTVQWIGDLVNNAWCENSTAESLIESVNKFKKAA